MEEEGSKEEKTVLPAVITESCDGCVWDVSEEARRQWEAPPDSAAGAEEWVRRGIKSVTEEQFPGF